LVDSRSADVNPEFYHLVKNNQIALNGRGFVMDRHYRAEVQNQPSYKYEIKYFKVSDRHPKASAGLSLQAAKVRIPSRYWDPFSNYRSRKAVAVVGIEAKIWYGLENMHPVGKLTDSPGDDKTDTLTIRYDLELDGNDEIVGGEWREHENSDAPTLVEQIKYQHPDILWLIPPGVKALSPGDFAAKSAWDGSTVVPAEWREASLKAGNKTYGDRVRGKNITRIAPQPLAKVVDVLIKKARQ
jgi:hypothetical protein